MNFHTICISLTLYPRSPEFNIYNSPMQEQFHDDWLDEEPQSHHDSLFNKTVITFTNDIIDQNVNRRMERPILNSQFQDEEPELEDGECGEHQTHTSMGKQTKQSSKMEALFNPMEDDDNQQWIKRGCKKAGRPLTCPSCFNQIAFNYTVQQQDQVIAYRAAQVFSVDVKQNKIIRQSSTSQTMCWSGVQSEFAQRELKERQQAFNIKIIADCSCGYTVGYFDINKESYVLTNVI